MTARNERRLELLYQFLIDYNLENGYAPNHREMCEEVGVDSTSLIAYYLRQLEDDGKIRITPRIARGVVVV